MKISIIVPVHNAAQYLHRCISSLVEQTENVEIILIENNSTDNSKELCEQYCAMYDNVIFLQANEMGVSNARNQGLKIATGEIIGFCDADDTYEPNALKDIVDIFEKFTEVDIVISGYYVCSVGKKRLRVYPNCGLCEKENIFPLLINDNRVMGSVWNKFFRKDVIGDEIFDIALTYCEDTHFVAKVLDNPKTSHCYILDVPTYCYYINENSITNSPDKVFNEDGESNIIVALKKIRSDCILSAKQNNEIAYAISRVAADLLNDKHPNNEQKNIIIQNIKENWRGYVCLMLKYGFKSKYDIKITAKRLWQILKCLSK